jgi:hypothetical protein
MTPCCVTASRRAKTKPTTRAAQRRTSSLVHVRAMPAAAGARARARARGVLRLCAERHVSRERRRGCFRRSVSAGGCGHP